MRIVQYLLDKLGPSPIYFMSLLWAAYSRYKERTDNGTEDESRRIEKELRKSMVMSTQGNFAFDDEDQLGVIVLLLSVKPETVNDDDTSVSLSLSVNVINTLTTPIG